MSNRPLTALEHLRERNTHYKRRDEFMAPEFCTIMCAPTAAPRRYDTDTNEQWILEVMFSVTFWANRVQYPKAREIAERTLIHRLYGDILADLSELKLAIINGDKDACLQVCFEMEGKLTKP